MEMWGGRSIEFGMRGIKACDHHILQSDDSESDVQTKGAGYCTSLAKIVGGGRDLRMAMIVSDTNICHIPSIATLPLSSVG